MKPKIINVEEKWKLIAKKLPPSTLRFIEIFMVSIEDFVNAMEKNFKLPDETVAILSKKGTPDWSNYYLEEPVPIIPLFELMLMASGIHDKFASDFDEISHIKRLMPLIEKIQTTKIDEKKFMRYFERNKIKFILLYRASLIDLTCLLTFGESMRDLILKARKKDETALFKVIQIDKGLLGAEWISKQIREASLQGNQSFFKKLGRALVKPSVIFLKHRVKLWLFLYLFWFLGLSKLTTSEIFDLIEKYGIYGTKDEESDVETLRKYLNKLGLKKYTRSKIDWDK